jgi:hypothetical protein
MTTPGRRGLVTAASFIVGAVLAAAQVPALAADNSSDLRAALEERRHALAESAFRRPMLVESKASAEDPSGEVYAILDQPFARVAQTLATAGSWCDILSLQTNIKRCTFQEGDSTVRAAVVRRFDQALSDAFEIQFRYSARSDAGRYLQVQLSADQGPLGTHDYHLNFEAMPVDNARSFVHVSYAYANGWAARMATNAYLAGSGKDKVGFSVQAGSAASAPVLVGGMQGVAERNAMRYFLAIESTVKSRSVPAPEQLNFRLRDWYAAIEKYPRQLHEMSLDEYLALKRPTAP